MNNYLILRSQNSPYNDVTKSSVLSFADMDDNLIFLKGNIIYTATTNGGIVTLKKYNGEDITFAGGGSGSGDSYWTSGSTGNYSIKTINDSTTDATGNYAVAEGADTLASGYASHAEGEGSIASGDYSHAEGASTIASGDTSHAEGSSTNASGYSSHAEGQQTIASGQGSHAEGITTIASGEGSHAEGQNTIASGYISHAEGDFTTASGQNSHAGGYDSIASGDTSFIHSKNSLVTGNRSVVLGGQNITGSTDDTVYVPYLNIQSTITDNAITEILVIDTNGDVKKRDVSTISGGGTFSGGTVTGSTSFTNGLTANTISATTYFNLPIDIFTTGGTYSNGTTTFTNNTGGTFNVTGYFKTSDDIYTTGMTFNASNYNLTITRNDNTSFTQSLSILASDLTVTGGTYNPNTGIGTFTNNTGGTFTVSGFLTGMTDTYTTGFTYSNNNLTLKRNVSQPDLTVLIDTMSGLTVNGLLSATTISGNTVYAVDFPQLPYTDNETVEVYSASGDTFLRVKDVVSAPSGGTRTFNGNINVTSGLTINGNLTYTGQTNNPVYTAGTVTATHIPNWNNSNIQHVILSAATTSISGGTNIQNGAVYTMILKQNASGSRTVNWGTQYKWQSGIAPVLSSTAFAVDIITLISDGTNLYGLIAKDFR
jgi:hypothetical protein